MEIAEIKEKMKSGDMDTVATALGLTRSNASHALRREGSKYHKAVKDKLEEVINLREIMISETPKINTEDFQ